MLCIYTLILCISCLLLYLLFFFFNDTPTTEIYTLSLHALFRSHVVVHDAVHDQQLAVQIAGAANDRSGDRKSTRLNSSHTVISYAVFCLKKKNSRRGSGYRRTQTAITWTRASTRAPRRPSSGGS